MATNDQFTLFVNFFKAICVLYAMRGSPAEAFTVPHKGALEPNSSTCRHVYAIVPPVNPLRLATR